MANNSFGTIFRITSFGESHGEFIGVVIDGCPAGLAISEEKINDEIKYRSPGRNDFVSTRKEDDKVKIISGIFEGKSTGAPITILITNCDIDSSKYESTKMLYKPGHADFSYLHKYGIYDYRGSGRASARETACRVAAGAIAKIFLDSYQIETISYIKSIGNITASIDNDIVNFKNKILESPIFCPDDFASKKMINLINKVKKDGDSIGGVVEFIIDSVPTGLGDPIYEKLNAKLANAMMSIPAAVGFEIGKGFDASKMKGSEYNDKFILKNRKAVLSSNNSGGILSGISTGMQIIGRVAFKPTPSISIPQKTVNHFENKEAIFTLPEKSRTDTCVAIRAVPVVNAMCRLVIAESILINRTVKI